jgi:hypothetical protein
MAKLFTFTDQQVRVRLYTDFMPNITGLSDAMGNLTVLEIKGLHPQNITNSFHQKILSNIQLKETTVQELVAIAQLRGLGLLVSETDEANILTLVVENPGPSSF